MQPEQHRPTTCQWLDGEPLARRFCGKPLCGAKLMLNGSSVSPYCEEHHKICYYAPRKFKVPRDETTVVATSTVAPTSWA